MIVIKTRQEIEKLRVANQIVAKALRKLMEMVKVGITTKELDEVAEEMVRADGAKPSFKGYRGFPKSLCTSINEEVVHGIPGNRKLKNGDILKIDLGAEYEGFYGDAALSLPVGDISDEAKKLLKITREALYLGIDEMYAGKRLYDISHAIQSHAESQGYSVVRDFVGHGIGAKPHEDPQVPNYGEKGTGPELKEGMVLAIEPMVNAGVYNVDVLEDNWTVVTHDRKLSAHFEHSVAITANGPDVLSEIS